MNQGQPLIDEVNATSVSYGQCAFWWLGQHGFIIKLGTAICYLDAYLTPNPGRQVPPLLKAEEVRNANLILGTHDHGDHIDRNAWPAMAAASPDATFIIPQFVRAKGVEDLGLGNARVIGLDKGSRVEVDGIRVTAVPAAHELLDIDPVTGLHPYLGYIVEGNGFSLYHAGDTCIYEGMQSILRQWKLDLALLPINGRDAKRLKSHCIGNMTYQEAVDLAGAIRPGLTIPTHFDMFAGNSENPQLFVDYMDVKYPGLRTMVPRHGERVVVERPSDR
jgi:L-ascorbate metabolism protein UlaG (beta-lactamase superfamily)